MILCKFYNIYYLYFHTFLDTIWKLFKSNKAKNVGCVIVLFWLNFLLSDVHASEPVVARYVRITLPGDERVLSLAEVQVYSGEKLISVLGKAKQMTTFRSEIAAATAEKAIDGITSGNFFTGSVTATLPGNFVWWELDLGSDREITKIVIYNRTDCCAERINPARIELRNSEQTIVWQRNIKSTQSRYEFDVNSTTTSQSPAGRNLLRNATFRQSTNPPLPDYWDLNHAAAVTFKELYRQYGIDASEIGPFRGVSVLKIVNSEDNFPYVMLSPTHLQVDLPGGDYTYSVFVKADRNSVIGVAKSESGQVVTKKITTEWRRYSFTFNERDGVRSLQPYMYFLKKGTYFVAAPQLEEGTKATPFDTWYGNGAPPSTFSLATQKLKTWVHSKLESENKIKEPTSALRSEFEYNYYTTQDTARLFISSSYQVSVNRDVTCVNTALKENNFFKKTVQILPNHSIYVDIPIKALAPGTFHCKVAGIEHGIDATDSTVDIKKLKPNQVEVRVNAVRRFFAINDVPFHIIGINVRAGATPPDWYFSDLKAHGINTIFYNRQPNSNGEYDLRNIKSVVTSAGKYDLKVIIGLPFADAKPSDWRWKLSTFLALIDQLRAYPQIIGWFTLDEPLASSWRDSELMEIYSTIKQADPYRLVFVNWNRVPEQVGQQPRGTLNATDVYATDYYPLMGPTVSMNGFTESTIRAALTASAYNKPSFTWLQLFGGGPAWREPTGAELNYMAYVNFIYGGMIGYWDTKSNSAATWERLRTINLQGKELAQKLFLSDDAIQLFQPISMKSFLYTAWKKGGDLFLIVLNRDSVAKKFKYNVSALTRDASEVSIQTLFGGRGVKLVKGYIDEEFSAYESKVYKIVPQ